MTGLGFRSPGVPLAITGTVFLGLALTPAMTRPHTVAAAVALRDNEALIMGGTGPCCVTAETPWGLPGPPYTTTADQLFIAPHFPGYTAVGLATPEQLAPLTGLDSEPFGVSLQQGTETLSTAITNDIAAGNVVAFGYSQSATIDTLELERLAALPADERPGTDQLTFVMIGDGNNPDGGLLERFDGAYIPSLDASFSGATPDDVYPTDIYTLQYDGWADYPQYPLNILADLNAFAGIAFVHGEYPDLTVAQVDSATELPTTATDTMTNYYLIPTENLPLLQPLELLGAPQWLTDLIEPDLRVLIELGYNRTAPADVPTPAELFPTDVNPITVIDNLVQGTATGVNNALTDVGLPDLPAQITGPITEMENLLTSLADQINPAVQAFSAGLQDALSGVTVPAQLAGALAPVSDTVSSADTALSELVDDEIDPAIQATVYDIGDPLREALTSLGAPDQLADGVYLVEELLPTVLEVPNDLLTNGVDFAATGLQDLVADNFDGFVQELELVPTGDITLSLVGDLLPVLGLADLLTGGSFSF